MSNYLSLANGSPNADTFERIFEIFDPRVVVSKMRGLLQSEEIAGGIIAFDGKMICGCQCEDGCGIHILSAFLIDAQIVIGEVMYDEKSNEVTAIPELWDMVNVEKSIVTIDAMGKQTKITERIVAQKADYRLVLKGNQSNLHDDARLYFQTGTASKTVVHHEKEHGCSETC